MDKASGDNNGSDSAGASEKPRDREARGGTGADVEIAGPTQALSGLEPLLAAISDITGLRYVVVARVTPKEWTAVAVLDRMNFGLSVGGSLPVETTMCSEVRDCRQPIVIDDTSTSEIPKSQLIQNLYGVRSYIAVPISTRDGEFFGTLCAIDNRPANLSGRNILPTLELFADLIASKLNDEAAVAALSASEERYRAFIANSSEGIWRFEIDEPIDTSLSVDEQIALAFRFGYLAECNDAMARQYGFESADQITGARLNQFLIPDDPRNVEYLRAFIESNYRLTDAESHEQAADGSDRYFSNNLTGVIENGFLVRAWGTQRDVTDVKKAARTVGRYRELSVRARDIIFFIEPGTGKIVEANRRAVDSYGYDYETLLGMSIRDLRAPEYLAPFDEQYALADRVGAQFETIHRRADGTRFPVEVSAIGSDVDDERLIVSIIRDISERRRAEDALAQNQAILSLAMRSSQMGFWERDMATGAVWWSEELEEIFGLDRGEFGGTMAHYESLVHEDDRPRIRTEIRAAISEHRSYVIEFRYRHKNGEIRWMEGRGEAVYSQSGEAVRVYGIGIDITSRRRSDEALRESFEFNQEVIDSMSSHIAVVDVEGVIQSVNEAWQNFALDNGGEWTMKGVGVGVNYLDVCRRAEAENAAEAKDICAGIESVLRGERRAFSLEYPCHSPVTERWFMLTVSPLKRGGAVIGHLNVTERRIAENRLATLAQISEQIRTERNVPELLYAVSKTLGEHLAVNRCLFNEIDLENDRETVFRDYCRNAASVAGEHKISDYSSSTTEEMLVGTTVVNEDSRLDPRTSDSYDAIYQPNGERAYVAVPMLRDGRWVASLWVSSDRPRRWLSEEISMIETIAERVWTAVERARSEQQLAKSAGTFSKLIEAAPFGVYVVDESFKLRTVNDGAAAVFSGIEPLLGRDFAEILREVWPEPFASEAISHFRHTLATGESYMAPTVTSDRNNVRRTESYDWQLHRVTLPDGTYGVVCYFYDLTAQKSIEDALRHSEERFRTLAENIPQLIWSAGHDGDLDFLSEQWQRYLGVEVEQIYLGGWPSVVHPDDLAGTERSWKYALETGENLEVKHRFRRADGVWRWQLVRAAPVRDESGRISKWFGTCTDIHETELDEQDARLLSEISEQIRIASEAAALMGDMARLTGRYLEIDRCYFAEIREDKDTWTIFNDYSIDSTSISGSYKLSDYGPGSRAALAKGITEIISDSKTDLRSSARYESSYAPLGVRADIVVPMLRDGRWAASFIATTERPRRWDAREIELMETIGERVWNAVEKLRLDASLRESEAEFRDLANSMSQFAWIADATGYISWYNERWFDYTGTTLEEMQGWGWQAVHHPDEVERVTKKFKESVAAGKVWEDEFPIRSKTGEFRRFLSRARPIKDETGKIVRWFGTNTDIEDTRRAQEALIAAERRAADDYQALLERIVPLGQTLGTARDLTTVYRSLKEFVAASMNCSAFFVSFYDSQTNLRMPAYVWGEGMEIDATTVPAMTLSADGGPNSKAVFERRTVITNNYWHEQQTRPHLVLMDNGLNPMSSIVVPMMVQNRVIGTIEVQAHENEAFSGEQSVALEMAGNLAAVAIENVRLIEVEARARIEAESANRAKDEFLSVLSHELRTPLNAMLGWVRMLRSEMLDAESSSKALEVIERNTRLQGSLIEDLLDVSRIISGKMRIETELTDLITTIQSVSETVRTLAEAKNIDVQIELGSENLFMHADPTRLQQVISNLVQNAIKFTPAGGQVLIGAARDGERAVLSITDSGIGIGAEFLPHIFDRFSQADASTKRKHSGLGLGLTIARTIVKLHGGDIEVASDGPGHGSTFSVSLPLAGEFYRASPAKSDVLTVGHAALDGKSILVVDDDVESMIPVRLYLENAKAYVETAESAAEALEKFAGRRFDIVISDIGMPGTDGFELIAKIREIENGGPPVIAIAMTAYASEDYREMVMRAGFQHHVPKPVNFDALLDAIRSEG